MAKWSVALYGHYKIDPLGDSIGRCQPGDVVCFKPISEAHVWTSNERKLFLIVSIDGVDNDQMSALTEWEYDLDSYRPYNLLTKVELAANYPKLTPPEIDKKYTTYVWETEQRSAIPERHWRKSRFNISLTDLQAKGVDIARMLDKKIEYTPTVADFNYINLYDKLRQRKILLTDDIVQIQPRTLDEIIENKTSEALLEEIRRD